MGRVGRFILKVAAVLILIVSAGTFALSLFTGETRNGDNLQSEFDYLITVGISQSGEESSWKDANTASFMDTFVKSNGYEAVYADAGSDQEKQIEDVEGFIKQGVDYIILNPISEIGWDDVLEDAKKAHIPVILVNNGVDTDDSSLYSCMLGSDYGKQMKKAGKWLDEYLKEEEEKKAEKEKAASEAPTQEESEQTDSEDTEVNTDSSKATDSSASIFNKIMKSSSTAKDEADSTEEEQTEEDITIKIAAIQESIGSEEQLTRAQLEETISVEEEIAACEKALEKAHEVIGDTAVAIDYLYHPRPLGLAKLLLTHGFRVIRIYLDSISPEEKAEFEWLKEHAPDLQLIATIQVKMRVLPRTSDEKILAIGQKAAWFTGSPYFVNMVQGGGLYGFDGIRRTAELMAEAFTEEKDTEDLVVRKGWGCESCI